MVLQPEHSGVILVTGNLYRGLREIIRDLLKLSKTGLACSQKAEAWQVGANNCLSITKLAVAKKSIRLPLPCTGAHQRVWRWH